MLLVKFRLVIMLHHCVQRFLCSKNLYVASSSHWSADHHVIAAHDESPLPARLRSTIQHCNRPITVLHRATQFVGSAAHDQSPQHAPGVGTSGFNEKKDARLLSVNPASQGADKFWKMLA